MSREHRRSLVRTSTSILLGIQALMICSAAEQATSTTQVDEARINSLLAQMNPYDEVQFLSGASGFTTAGNAALHIKGLHLADGPNGVRSNDKEPATAFPVGIALASSWNPQLAEQVGAAIGEEALALGVQVLLGPNLNLVRSPLAGRNFETFGEDPLLAGSMGVGYVRGVQSVGVAATPKHYVGNEQETERNRGSSNIDARALHELYLRPFEMVVRDAKPWALMTAYNRVNGTFMSENNQLVRQLLKQQWGFDGVVMSDWGGTHSTQAINAGLDLEMPGPGFFFGDAMLSAMDFFQVSSTDVEEATRRMLRLGARVGALDAPFKSTGNTTGVTSTAAHLQIARAVAAQGITLLKNSSILPLDVQRDRKIAVIGPNADVAIVGGGGSAYVVPSSIESPLDAIKALAGNTELRYVRGVDNELFIPVIDGRDLSTTHDRKQRGLSTRYYRNANFAGKPVKTTVEQDFGAIVFADEINRQHDLRMSVQWRGYYWPRVTGDYTFEYDYIRVMSGSTLTLPEATASARVKLDGKVLLDTAQPALYEKPVGFFPTEKRRATVHLIAGRGYPLAIDYASNGYRAQHFRLGVRQPTSSIAAAVQAARDADVALVFVGSGTTTETEGRDRSSMALYGEQDELVQQIAAVNPRTVVILNNGGPVAMPWVDRVAAIVEAWLPGQEGAAALADVLFGKINPSGKLPVSFPKRVEDSPSYLFFPGFRDANYGESIFMGYRYYDAKRIEPLFAFGHGLSYTQFEYTNLRLPPSQRSGQALAVRVDIKNVGARAGAEVAQLYVADEQCREPCPLRELKGFVRVELQPGETRTIDIDLDTRGFAHYDAYSDTWQTTPGKYVVSVGSSSRDLRLSGGMELLAE